MTVPGENVVQLHREEFKNTPSASVEEIFPGFSERFNILLDLSDLEIPKSRGKAAYVAELFETSQMAPADWLKKDKPPKPATLRKIVIFLLNHIDKVYSSLKVEAWLKYGDEAVGNPFSYKEEEKSLIPLAAGLISEVAKANKISAVSFELTKVLSAVVKTLSDFEVSDISLIERVHHEIVLQHIKANSR